MMEKTKTEASHFKWVKWKNALCAGLQMATSASSLIEGFLSWGMATSAGGLINSCLLPLVVWLIATFACGWINGVFCRCDLIDGVFCLWEWLIDVFFFLIDVFYLEK